MRCENEIQPTLLATTDTSETQRRLARPWNTPFSALGSHKGSLRTYKLPSDLSSPFTYMPRQNGRSTSRLAPASPDTNNVTSDTHPPYPASQTASRLQEAPRHPVLKRRDVSSPPSRPPSDSTGVGRADRCRRLGFNTPIPNIPEDLTKLSSGEGIVASSRQAVAISAARREGRQGCLHT